MDGAGMSGVAGSAGDGAVATAGPVAVGAGIATPVRGDGALLAGKRISGMFPVRVAVLRRSAAGVAIGPTGLRSSSGG